MKATVHGWIALGATIAIAVLGGTGVAQASTNFCNSANPINDSYLCSLNFNNPGRPLNASATLEDLKDTSNATVQSDVFNPCNLGTCPNGPAETTTCNGVSYGKTIWYDFYPNANGLVSIRTSAFYANAITVYQYNSNTLVPDASTRACSVSTFGGGQLVVPVKKNAAYTLQIGGVNGAGGKIQVLFDYFKSPPRRLSATAFLKAKTLTNGLSLVNLTVTTNRGAKVSVRCGGFCTPKSKTVPKFGSNTEQFPGLAGVAMPSGSKLQIRVTAPHSIGVFIEYTILPGNFTKETLCLEPGSQTPRSKCH